MPSGHATVAFALASTISERFDNSWWVAPGAYALASLVAFSRTRANAHFASDVLVGAAIGTATGRTVVDLERARERAEAQTAAPHASLRPQVGPGAAGLALDVVF
jgi:membrane-associated phospholipid phosphatase